MESILLIDDDLDTLRLLGERLEKHGYRIFTAVNGRQGIEKALSERPQLIVLDVMMPDIDGYEVTRRIRGDSTILSTAILIFTAKSQQDDQIAGYEAGADDYLTKPVHPKELVAHIEALIREKRLGLLD